MNSASIIFLPANHLYPSTFFEAHRGLPIVMVEDLELCARRQYHQQKIALLIAAMREHAAALRKLGHDVRYFRFAANETITSAVAKVCAEVDARTLITFELTDHRLANRLRRFCATRKLDWQCLEDPGFLTSKGEFLDFAGARESLSMAQFYRHQRRRLDLLLVDGKKPVGGKWSFDADNRKKLPKSQSVPELSTQTYSTITLAALEEVAQRFSTHPGVAQQLWLPTQREDALSWLQAFVEQRLVGFGTFEDALSQRSATLFHSALSPLLNLGLLTPGEVLGAVVDASAQRGVPLNDLEGFVRQLVGWREFVRGVYERFGQSMQAHNRRAHTRRLTHHWHDATTGIAPLDAAIRHQLDLGFTHHINRLMVVANLMNLCEIQPTGVYDYFMCYYLDAYDWVMVPNVYGMGLTSDDGVFATKPYVCGSNYLLKMSDFPRGDWCDVLDGLYWRFVERNKAEYRANPRLSLSLGHLQRLPSERRAKIFTAADRFLERCTR